MGLFVIDIDESHEEELSNYLKSFKENEIDYFKEDNPEDLHDNLAKLLSRNLARKFNLDENEVIDEFLAELDEMEDKFDIDDIDEELDDEFEENYHEIIVDEFGKLKNFNVIIEEEYDEFYEIFDFNLYNNIENEIRQITLEFDQDASAIGFFITENGFKHLMDKHDCFFGELIVVKNFEEKTIRDSIDFIKHFDKFRDLFIFDFDDDIDDDFNDDFDDFMKN